MSTSSNRPSPLRQPKAHVAALAACAALAGGAQLLLPATAGAEATDGPRCGGQFFQELWCFQSESAQGGGSEPVPACDESRGNYCVSSEHPSRTPRLEAKVDVGGRQLGGQPRDLDAKRGRGVRSGGSGVGDGQRFNCRVPGQQPILVNSKGECESRRRLARETPEQRERREAACQILDVVIGSLEEQKKLDVQFDQMQEAVFGPIGLTTEEKRRRAGQERRLKRYDRAWLKADCVQFVPPAEDAKG
jgi:hypothetical protein